MLLQGLKWVDATAMPFDAAIAELAATLGAPIDRKRVARSTRRWRRSRRVHTGCTGLVAVLLIVALVTGLLKLLPAITGDITEYPFAGSSDPGGITVGSDGALWFLSQYAGADKIGRMTTDGAVTEYTLSTTATFGRNIASGPDGNLWFAVGDSIGRFTP